MTAASLPSVDSATKTTEAALSASGGARQVQELSSALEHVAATVSADLLGHAGWAVSEWPDAGKSALRALAGEARKLLEAGVLKPHTFQFVDSRSGEAQQFEHPGRDYLELTSDQASHQALVAERTASAPLLAAFAFVASTCFAKALAARLPELRLRTDLEGLQVKLQRTHGDSGCAPCHFDTSDTAPRRQVTLLLYLSESWTEEHGAELCVQPFLQPCVRLAPVFGRCAVFLADRTLHWSLPPSAAGTHADRWLMTVWIDGDCVDMPFASPWAPALRRLLSPALYSEEYRTALRASFPAGPARTALCAQQEREISDLEGDPDLCEMLSELRAVLAEEAEEEDAEIHDVVFADGSVPEQVEEDLKCSSSAGCKRARHLGLEDVVS